MNNVTSMYDKCPSNLRHCRIKHIHHACHVYIIGSMLSQSIQLLSRCYFSAFIIFYLTSLLIALICDLYSYGIYCIYCRNNSNCAYLYIMSAHKVKGCCNLKSKFRPHAYTHTLASNKLLLPINFRSNYN